MKKIAFLLTIILIGCSRSDPISDSMDRKFAERNYFISWLNNDENATDMCIVNYCFSGCFHSYNYIFTISNNKLSINVPSGYDNIANFSTVIPITKYESDILNSHIQWARTENNRGGSTNHHSYDIFWYKNGSVIKEEKYENNCSDIPYSVPIWLYVNGLTKR